MFACCISTGRRWIAAAAWLVLGAGLAQAQQPLPGWTLQKLTSEATYE